MQKTKPTRQSEIKRQWHLYDIKGKILGRAASEIATVLRGKHKTNFVPHLDCGDYVVVINAGNKKEQKIYTRYSGYPGGLRRETLKEVLAKDPTRVIKQAVAGMLPDNKLKDRLLKRLYVFIDENHPYKDKLNKKIESK